MRRLPLLVIAGLAAAGSAAASERCNQPYAPAIKATPSPSIAQITSLRSDVNAFMAASEIYQKCVLARGEDPRKLDANQAAQERVAREFNGLVKTIKLARAG
jgi:hypothetical protein